VGILIFKGLTARSLYKSFGVKGLKPTGNVAYHKVSKSKILYFEHMEFVCESRNKQQILPYTTLKE
jgi:hypothetical protein